MIGRTKTFISLVLAAGGVLLFGYGLFVHGAYVAPNQGGAGPSMPGFEPGIGTGFDPDPVLLTPPVFEPEPALIREVAIGGLERDDWGQLRKTYSGKAPKACPT